MTRFSSIIYGCALVLAVTAAQGQTARPAPINGPAPMNGQLLNTNQQPMRQGTPAPNEVQQMRQQQQMGQPQQQQPARPADPPANTPPPPDTPPSPPVVTYRDGMLTVQALNSTLSSVVAAIKNKTGIEFEGFDNTPDRVAISLGPAPSGEVLSSIFAGSKFDFVAIGRPDSPGVVQRVILSPRKAPGGTLAAQKPTQNAGDNNDDEDTPDETVNAGDPQDTAVQPPQPQQAQQQNQPQNQEPSQPKTPEQLMQELQEMQKQQQQQQQGGQNPAQVPRKQPPL